MKDGEQAAQLRLFTDRDRAAVEHLLHRVWSTAPDAIPYYRYSEPIKDERYLHTLVAEHDGQIVGMSSVWKNKFHPHSAYIGIHVDPRHQAQGVGAALWNRLIAECAPARRLPLQTATYEHQQRARRFLEARGFHETKRTYQPTLDLQAVELALLHAHVARVVQAGYTIHTLAELAGDHERDKIVELWANIYSTTHRSNPPVERTSPLWHDAVFDDLIEDACFVAVKDGEYAALSSLRPHDTPGCMWLDLRGVAERHRAHEIDLILALTQRELVYALEHGVTTLQAEIDTDDPWMMLLLEHFPFSTSAVWITFRRERP
jgi:GNAT superfamily N-acetyltransferase